MRRCPEYQGSGLVSYTLIKKLFIWVNFWSSTTLFFREIEALSSNYLYFMLYSIPCCFYTCCFRLSKNWQYKQIRNNLFVHCMQQLTTSQMDPKIPDFIYSSKLEDENLETLNLWPRSVFWEANVSNFPLSMHFLAQIPLCYQWFLAARALWQRSITHFALKTWQKLRSNNFNQLFATVWIYRFSYI